MNSEFNWKELFEKFEDIDNDLRYMGLSDLSKSLEKGLEMQGVTETRVVNYLVKLFFDVSTDVQGEKKKEKTIFIYSFIFLKFKQNFKIKKKKGLQ